MKAVKWAFLMGAGLGLLAALWYSFTTGYLDVMRLIFMPFTDGVLLALVVAPFAGIAALVRKARQK